MLNIGNGTVSFYLPHKSLFWHLWFLYKDPLKPTNVMKDNHNWLAHFSSALLSLLLLMTVDSTKTVAASTNQQCGNLLQETLKITRIVHKESGDLIKTYVSRLQAQNCSTLQYTGRYTCALISYVGWFLSFFPLFAESRSRGNVRALLQGVGERHPWSQHLWAGSPSKDSKHLHASPSFPPTF